MLIALIKPSDDDVPANVGLDVGSYKMLDWHNKRLDAYEYRLDIPATP